MRALRQLVTLLALAIPVAGTALAQDEGPIPLEDRPRAICAPAVGPITVDGKLDANEWDRGTPLVLDERALVRRDEEYGGDSDLSGKLFVSRSATMLYVGGEILDDTLFWNPKISWLGDGVELFFDFNTRRSEQPPPEDGDEPGYDQYTHQLLLHPLAPEVRWGFALFRGNPGRMDLPVDGVLLAGLPLRDEQRRATIGYSFELALPLANFPAAQNLKEGETIGFDIALSDSDGREEQKNYATWSGNRQLSQFPGRFGRMEFVGTPPPPPSPEQQLPSAILPLAVLVACLGALLFTWLARAPALRGHRMWNWIERLAQWSLRGKGICAGVLVALIVALSLLSDLAADVLTSRDIAAKRGLVTLIRDIASEARALRLLEPQPPEHPAPLVSLLSGEAIQPAPEYEYVALAPQEETPHRTLDGVPFLRRDVPIHAPWSGDFLVHPPARAHAATLVYSWRPSATAGTESEGPALGDVVAEVRFVHRDGVVDEPTKLVWGTHVDAVDAVVGDASSTLPSAPAARAAFVETTERDGRETTEHAAALDVPLPDAAGTEPLVRIEVRQNARGGTFVVHGITLHPVAGSDPLPLPLGRATETGIPTVASPYPHRHSGLLMSSRHPRAYVECDARADALWLVASLRDGYEDHRYRVPVLLVEVVFDDGSVDGPFRLENGVTIDAERRPARQRSGQDREPAAFEWMVPGQTGRHYGLVPLDLDREGRRVQEVQFEFVGDTEIVRVASVTAGARVPRDPAQQPQRRLLDGSEDGFRIARDRLRELEELTYTLYRDQAAVATTTSGPRRNRQLARRLSPEFTAEVRGNDQGVHAEDGDEGRRLHTLSIAVPGLTGTEILEVAWGSNAEQQFGHTVSLLRRILAILLAPMLVLIVADLVLRIPALHPRLCAAFAAAAAAPVALGFFAVPEFLEAKIETDERAAVAEKALTVKAHIAQLRSQARRHAEATLRDEALQQALKRRGSDEFRPAVAAALRDIQQNLRELGAAEARVALEIFPLSSAGEGAIVFPEQARHTIFAGPTINRTDQLAFRWSRLAASGVASQYDSSGDWRTTVVVELPLERAALGEAANAAGGGTDVLLYTARGYPLAGTVEIDGEDTYEELERKETLLARVLEEQAEVIETRLLGGSLYTVTYDVLRGQEGPMGLIATALPRSATESLLNRVGWVSLLVFGAGVLMQFVLTGVVVGATSRPFARVLEHAELAAPSGLRERVEAGAETVDEIAVLDASVAAVEADREVYRAELGNLFDAVGRLGAVFDPDAVVERSLELLRSGPGPWGALLLVPDRGGPATLLGGFREYEELERRSVQLHPDGPFARAVRGEGETQVARLPGTAEALSDDERELIRGAISAHAFPLGTDDGGTGALVLLEGVSSVQERPHYHAEYVATLARHIGLALTSARLVRLAVRDPETGAYVVSYFEQRLQAEIDRALTAKRSVALLLVRASGLPQDTDAARQALRRLGETLTELAPARALLGRVTSDVLGVAVPEADRAAGESLVSALRKKAAEAGLAPLRLRTGLAACPEDAGSYEFLRQEARSRLDAASGTRSVETPTVDDNRARLIDEARQHGVVFQSDEGVQILDTVERIAASNITILVEGETGSGKEAVADLIHEKSPRRDHALIKVNCAALPDALLESELFGYERGAFTGADQSKPGRFELADGGTLFLDEIGDMPLATQVKLLRVLEARTVEHLGGTRPIPIDVRVIAATNRNLRQAIADGSFREDLYYRLNAVTIAVPPLRRRKQDLPALVETFVHAAAETHGRKAPTVSAEAMDLLFRHDWPGNVRELRNAIEQAVVLSGAESLSGADLLPALRSSSRLRAPTPTTTHATPRSAPASASAGISDRQRRLLAVLSEQEWITNSEYCDLVGVSSRTGLRDLKELIRSGALVMEGKRRGARYRLA